MRKAEKKRGSRQIALKAQSEEKLKAQGSKLKGKKRNWR